jgi:hypothetical protein
MALNMSLLTSRHVYRVNGGKQPFLPRHTKPPREEDGYASTWVSEWNIRFVL